MIRWGWRLDSPENGKGLALGRGKCSRNELVQFTRGAQRKVMDVEGDFTTEVQRARRKMKDVEGDFTTEAQRARRNGKDGSGGSQHRLGGHGEIRKKSWSKTLCSRWSRGERRARNQLKLKEEDALISSYHNINYAQRGLNSSGAVSTAPMPGKIGNTNRPWSMHTPLNGSFLISQGPSRSSRSA